MMWIVIDVVLLIILPLRKYVTRYQNEMYQRSIESVKSLSTRFSEALLKVFLLISVSLIIYIVMDIVPNVAIQILLKWYIGIFIVALLPMFYERIEKKTYNIKSIWNGCLTVLAILFSMVGYIIDIENVEEVSENRVALNILITIFVTIFGVALFEMGKGNNENYSKKLSKPGIRKDVNAP